MAVAELSLGAGLGVPVRLDLLCSPAILHPVGVVQVDHSLLSRMGNLAYESSIPAHEPWAAASSPAAAILLSPFRSALAATAPGDSHDPITLLLQDGRTRPRGTASDSGTRPVCGAAITLTEDRFENVAS